MHTILRLLGRYLILLFVYTAAIFALVNLVPGLALSGQNSSGADARYQWFLLDRPLLPGQYCPPGNGCHLDGGQYIDFYQRAFTGNWGNSWSVDPTRPAAALFLERLPASLAILGLSILFLALLALPAGAYLAFNQRQVVLPGIFTVFRSIPVYWLGMLLFVLAFGLQGIWGAADIHRSPGYILLPALVVFVFISPRWFQSAYQAVKTALESEPVRKARNRNFSQPAFIAAALLPAALVEFLPGFIRSFPVPMFGATIFAETVFAWPGLGNQFIAALRSFDWPIVQAQILPPALAFFSAFLLADIFGALLQHRKEPSI